MRKSWLEGHPLRQAFLAQVIGGAATVLFASWIFSVTPVKPEAMLVPLAFVQGGFAALVARLLKSPPWWIAIHLVFLPLVVGLLRLGLPPWLYLVAFLFLLAVFWRTDVSRVPLYLSSREVAQALAERLPEGPRRVIDLGCGDGRLLAELARLRPDCHFVGIEHAPLPWLVARVRNRGHAHVDIRHGDFWRESLAGYDLVYAFLSPAPMPMLWGKACAEMKAEALLVSNSFAIPGVAPEAVLTLSDRRRSRLYLYRPEGMDKTA